jgi:hypothetical protein
MRGGCPHRSRAITTSTPERRARSADCSLVSIPPVPWLPLPPAASHSSGDLGGVDQRHQARLLAPGGSASKSPSRSVSNTSSRRRSGWRPGQTGCRYPPPDLLRCDSVVFIYYGIRPDCKCKKRVAGIQARSQAQIFTCQELLAIVCPDGEQPGPGPSGAVARPQRASAWPGCL